jgi:hypothetical protein
MDANQIKPEGKSCCLCEKLSGIFLILAGTAGILTVLNVVGGRRGTFATCVLLILAGLPMVLRGACRRCCSHQP